MEPEDTPDIYRFFDPLYNWDEKKLRAWLQQQDPDQIEQAVRFFKFKYNEHRRVIAEQELRRLRRNKEASEMARKASPPPPQQAALSVESKQLGIKRFEKVIERLKSFDPNVIPTRGDIRVTELEHAIRTAIEKTYPPGTAEYNRLIVAKNIDTASINLLHPTPLSEVREGLASGRDRAIMMLREEIASLSEDIEATPSQAPSRQEKTVSRSVFVVHGHDEAARETVAAYLRKLDLIPIILHEHAHEGRTIIEKFEQKSDDVGFAVILLTPDDVGGKSPEQLRARARQNVILELGYFVAKLGRRRVCAIKKGDVEVPTDYIGVGYIDLDARGGWKFELAREIKASGIDIDLNKAV